MPCTNLMVTITDLWVFGQMSEKPSDDWIVDKVAKWVKMFSLLFLHVSWIKFSVWPSQPLPKMTCRLQIVWRIQLSVLHTFTLHMQYHELHTLWIGSDDNTCTLSGLTYPCAPLSSMLVSPEHKNTPGLASFSIQPAEVKKDTGMYSLLWCHLASTSPEELGVFRHVAMTTRSSQTTAPENRL